jgi:hypothetical protein
MPCRRRGVSWRQPTTSLSWHKAVALLALQLLRGRGAMASIHSWSRHWMGWVVSVTPRLCFTPGERTAGTHCTGGWVDLRAGLDTEARGKFPCLCRGSNPGRPGCSQTLYWLSYPSSHSPDIGYVNTVSYSTMLRASLVTTARRVLWFLMEKASKTLRMYSISQSGYPIMGSPPY